MGSLEQECNQKRNDVLGYAFRLADEGAHYLWGANGDKPTKDGNVEYADVVLDPDKPEKSSFCAASIVEGGITYVCAGRFRHGDLASTPPINKIVVTANAPVNKDSAPMKEVLAFIEKNRNNKAAQIGWGFDLTPRVVKGDSIKDYSTGTDVTNAVVWGEGCDDTLHFDCGGFVRYVVKKVCSVPIDGISANPGQKNILGEVMATEVKEGEPVLPADILVYAGHIAFAMGVPQENYNKLSHYAVAQAESAVYGVNYGKKHGQASQKCIRLSPSTLLNRKVSA